MLRNRKKILKVVKNIDAFPKTSEECINPSSSGGTVSLLSFVTMGILLVWECSYYLDTKFVYKFHPDLNFDEKLKINMDITVAMPCSLIGADILDVTGQHVMTHDALVLEETWFELDSNQLAHFQGVQRVNSYLRNEYHAIQDVLWRNGYIDIFGGLPTRKEAPKYEKDACRVTGSVVLNKVAGNLHITAGKSIQLPRGHAHLAMFMDDKDYNFTHRIDKLSFGDAAPGIIHPLEGDQQVSDKHMMMYQYFITVVPTKVNTYRQYGNTYQYSVSELGREISHKEGSHGTPGIYFKYDVSALKVEVIEQHEPFLEFLTRLIGITGGIFTCNGLIHRFVQVFFNLICCQYFRKSPNDPSDEFHKAGMPTTLEETPLLHSPSLALAEKPLPPLPQTTISNEGTFLYPNS